MQACKLAFFSACSQNPAEGQRQWRQWWQWRGSGQQLPRQLCPIRCYGRHLARWQHTRTPMLPSSSLIFACSLSQRLNKRLNLRLNQRFTFLPFIKRAFRTYVPVCGLCCVTGACRLWLLISQALAGCGWVAVMPCCCVQARVAMVVRAGTCTRSRRQTRLASTMKAGPRPHVAHSARPHCSSAGVAAWEIKCVR